MNKTNLEQMPSAKDIELSGNIFEDCNLLIEHSERFREAALRRERELLIDLAKKEAIIATANHVKSDIDGAASIILAEIKAQAVRESDYFTHHFDWKAAVEIALENAENEGNKSYWDHQLNTLDNLESEYAHNLRGQADDS